MFCLKLNKNSKSNCFTKCVNKILKNTQKLLYYLSYVLCLMSYVLSLMSCQGHSTRQHQTEFPRLKQNPNKQQDSKHKQDSFGQNVSVLHNAFVRDLREYVPQPESTLHFKSFVVGSQKGSLICRKANQTKQGEYIMPQLL